MLDTNAPVLSLVTKISYPRQASILVHNGDYVPNLFNRLLIYF